MANASAAGMASAAGKPDQFRRATDQYGAARGVADRRIDAVVGNKHRGAYQRVAVIAVAVAVAYAEAWPLPRTRRSGPHTSRPYAAAIPGTWPSATNSTEPSANSPAVAATYHMT